MNIILTALAAILIFAVMIFVHELGHFIAAKALGVKVNEFALGMGPKIISKQKGETLYSLRLFPIGGFCAMEGEDEETKDERSFSNKKPWKRLIILVAGAAMNIVLGFVLLLGLNTFSEAYMEPVITEVTARSAADEAGIMSGDRILKVNGRNVNIVADFRWEIERNGNDDLRLDFVMENNGEKRKVSVVPDIVDNRPVYGIKYGEIKENSIFATVKNSVYETIFYARVVIDSLFDLIRGRVPISQVSGPVGIVNEIGNAVEQAQQTGAEGIINLIGLAILLTVNLGVFNLLPFPALDGGRILFVVIEMIRRKPVPVEKEAIVHFVGIVILLGLSVLIAFKDIFTIW